MLGGIGALLALIFFIVAHEAGHFLAAKATGMKVTEFFLGFGPRIWSFRRGETEYGIKPIPFGAYVKIVGMSALEEVPPEDRGRTYREKPFWAKTVVVLAGVGANFLIAYLMFFGLALAEGRPVLVDGEPVPTRTVATIVDTTDDGATTAAVAAGIREGDVVVAVDGAPTPDWDAVSAALAARPGQQIDITVERDGTTLDLTTTLGSRTDPQTGEVSGFLGVGPEFERESIGIGTAAVGAGGQVVDGVRFTFISFARLLRLDTITELAGGIAGGEVSNDVRPVSPVGIVQIGAQADELGVANLLYLLAIVNVILGTLNALPLYPLDGGHFAVALYEKVTGREPDIRRLIPLAVMVIGALSLIGIMALLLDILQPIRL